MIEVSIVGTITQEPKQFTTGKGEPMVSLNVVHNDRRRDDQGGWSDGPPTYYRVVAYSALARNALASFRKGQRIVATGALTMDSYTLDDGQTRIQPQVRASALGHDLQFGTTAFSKTQRAASGEAQATQTTDAQVTSIDSARDAAPAAASATSFFPDEEEPAWFSAV